MQFDLRRVTRCHVCGFTEVRTDEAYDRELVFLAECPRCDHRWTAPRQPVLEIVRAQPMQAARREVVSAA
jgi:hypothetical protein